MSATAIAGRLGCERPSCERAAAYVHLLTPFGCPNVCEPCAEEIDRAMATTAGKWSEVDALAWLPDAMRHGPLTGRAEWIAAGRPAPEAQ